MRPPRSRRSSRFARHSRPSSRLCAPGPTLSRRPSPPCRRCRSPRSFRAPRRSFTRASSSLSSFSRHSASSPRTSSPPLRRSSTRRRSTDVTEGPCMSQVEANRLSPSSDGSRSASFASRPLATSRHRPGERESVTDDPWKQQLEAFGQFIHTQRKLARLSLRDLSDRTEISNAYLSQIERGIHAPSVRVLKSLADAFNISAETMLEQAGIRRRAGRRWTAGHGGSDPLRPTPIRGAEGSAPRGLPRVCPGEPKQRDLSRRIDGARARPARGTFRQKESRGDDAEATNLSLKGRR